jgi:beta-lactamase superfamily II metal-dependent hydrolase
MARLAVTMIDVGWGDSILIESDDGAGNRRFALVDCNDYETERTSLIFVKRFFERERIDYEANRPNFEWVLLTHGHADHARGMKGMLSLFGTRHFWYPKSVPTTTYGSLLEYANRSDRVQHHQSVDSTKILDPSISFGGVSLTVLWPEYDQVDASNENNNSVVLAVTLGQVSFVLTGDAEAENWATIAARLPPSIRVFQVPHHGGRNGTFGPGDITPWLDVLPAATQLALSSHIRPHGHPHADVVNILGMRNLGAFRTDQQSHLTFSTDGTKVEVRYSHV